MNLLMFTKNTKRVSMKKERRKNLHMEDFFVGVLFLIQSKMMRISSFSEFDIFDSLSQLKNFSHKLGMNQKPHSSLKLTKNSKIKTENSRTKEFGLNSMALTTCTIV